LKPARALVLAIVLAPAACRHLPWLGDDRPPATASTPIVPRRGEVVIAAWAEPRQIPKGGGEVRIVVRVQRVGGEAYPGVQVQLQTTKGTLASAGRPLVTDAHGLAHDRLTSRRPAEIAVRVGDMRYRFKVETARQGS
jgi:hypothetical protein